MSLKLLLDENLRDAALWKAIAAHQQIGQYPLDVVRVGDPASLPLGVRDGAILAWASDENRILISLDAKTLGIALANRLVLGGRCPGIILIRDGQSVGDIVDLLLLVSHASEASDWANTLQWLP